MTSSTCASKHRPWLSKMRSGLHERIFAKAALAFLRCRSNGSRIPKTVSRRADAQPGFEPCGERGGAAARRFRVLRAGLLAAHVGQHHRRLCAVGEADAERVVAAHLGVPRYPALASAAFPEPQVNHCVLAGR